MKAAEGLRVVRSFFPEAKLGTNPVKGALNALDELARVEEPSAKDVVAVFDRNYVGIWGGIEIR